MTTFSKSAIGSCLMLLAVVSVDAYATAIAPTPPVPELLGGGPPEHRVAFGQALPVIFEPNQGQTDTAVKFLARGVGYSLFLSEGGATLALRGDTSREAQDVRGRPPAVLRMRLLGMLPDAELIGEDTLPGKVSYFRGKDPSGWRSGLPTYAKVRYRGVYPGIDLVYYGTQGQVEYDLVLAPGADPKAIRLAFDGADDLRLDTAGNLVVTQGEKALIQRAPRAYQTIGGERATIPARYLLADSGEVSVEIGTHDSSQTLVIDPILVYSTYFGGSGYESGNSIAVDAAGNAYVAGETGSIDFPGEDLQHPTFDGNTSDAFVAKFDASGSAVAYAVYFGGSGYDNALAIAVDDDGNAYLVPGRKVVFNRKNNAL
ncbi:SBBP repeat-containing protein [Thiococcus pfennigii]|uniref:DUF7948 domain-containing protein n=1 Tax=Thiococcus pfennigii TaxID=1057 RepID=UPI001F5C05D3|nr:SBBP repeat-containing protein [Thiococcus pfennigii]